MRRPRVEEPCKVGEHIFDHSRITNEPVGGCGYCGASVEWCERQVEEAEELAALMPAEEPTLDQDPNLVIDEVGAVIDTQEQMQALIFAEMASVEDFGMVLA